MPDNFESNFKEGLQFFQNKQYDEAILKFKDAINQNSNSPEAHYYLGRSYIEIGFIDESIKEYQISLQLNPKDADAHFDLGRLYYNDNQIKKAIEELGRAFELNPDNQVYSTCICHLYLEKKLVQEGILFLRNAIEKNPRNVWNHYLLGVLFNDNGSLDEALNEFKEQINLDPSKPEYYHSVGIQLRRMGKTDEARDFLKNAVKLFPDNKELTLEESKIFFDSILDLCNKNLWDDAIDLYKKVLDYETKRILEEKGKLTVADSPSTEFLNSIIKEKKMESIGINLFLRLYPQYSEKSELYSGLREFLELKKIKQEVIDDYLSLIRERKNCAAIHLNLAQELNRHDLHEIAIDEYRRGLCFKPDLAWPHCEIAEILMMELNKRDEALEEFSEGLTKDPDNPHLAIFHEYFALILLTEGRIDEALSHFHKSIMLVPNITNTAYNEVLDLFNLGYETEAEQFFKKSIELYKEMDNKNPDVLAGLSESHSGLAEVYEKTGRMENAIYEFRQAINLSPKDPELHNSVGNLLLKTNNIIDAISEYRQAIQYNSKNGLYHKNLADALIKDHQTFEARDALRKSMILIPEDKNVVDAYINLEIAIKDSLRDKEIIEQTIKSEFKKYSSSPILSQNPEADHEYDEIKKKIDEKDWETIIKRAESRHMERKQSLRWSEMGEVEKRISEYNVMRTIAAFINIEGGGILFIGVSDKGEIVGLHKDYATLDKRNSDGFRLRIDQLINDYLGKEYHPYITVDIVNIQRKEICIIIVKKGKKWAYLKERDSKKIIEHFFIRGAGASTLELSAAEASDYIKNHW